ncbi:MAG TPA: hypothetical protein VMT53_18725 [Terriglobales bacterium]|nr:hypothetical protein [Terriglobales bacterium]
MLGLMLLALLGIPAAYAQNTPASAAKSSDTSYVTCGEKAATSRTVSSDIFVAPDGKRPAYTRVVANSVSGQLNPARISRVCVNNSLLFVKSEADFDLVFLQEASDTETGNSLQIVDWSADSHRLLLELAQWQYDSPGVTRSVLVYQAELGVFQQPDLSRAFRKQFGIDCSLNVHVAGFTAEGKIVIDTQPMTPEEEEVLAIPSCSPKKAQWILNPASESIAPLPEGAKLVHNAKMEAQPQR